MTVLESDRLPRPTDLDPIIAALRVEGIATAAGLARALNTKGIPTAQGGDTWTTTQVQRLLGRLDA